MRFSAVFTAVIAILACGVSLAHAEVWNQSIGGSWDVATNWNPNNVPNAEGANATFNGAATGSNPDQTANRTVTLDGAKTVGSIIFNTDLSSFTNSITTGGGGPLTFDAAGAGPATITTMGGGTGNNTISVAMVLNDLVTATVNNTTATSAAGSLNLTAAISGDGGFTKEGAGTATFGTGAKTYTGPTVLNGGRLRMSFAARAQNTSSFTINANSHLEMISDGVYTLGSGTLFLNGTGIPGNDGAIRPSRETANGRKMTITNPIELLSTSLIHSQSQSAATPDDGSQGYIKLTGVISGSGPLQLTAPSHNEQLGTYILTAANTYTGGTELYGGRLVVGRDEAGGIFSGATLGTGDVTVFNSVAPFGTVVNGEARGHLTIPDLNPGGIENAISDLATVTLGGGFTGSLAQAGYAELLAGVDETIGTLVLGATTFTTPGTYGHPNSSADFRPAAFAEFFADNTGVFRIAAPAGVLGDFNDDGKVDAADYVAWRKNETANGALPNDNGVGTQVERYTLWMNHFGEMAMPGGGAGSGAPVPEPSTLVLIGLSAQLALLGRRARHGV